jgi:hypothetical protein
LDVNVKQARLLRRRWQQMVASRLHSCHWNCVPAELDDNRSRKLVSSSSHTTEADCVACHHSWLVDDQLSKTLVCVAKHGQQVVLRGVELVVQSFVHYSWVFNNKK